MSNAMYLGTSIDNPPLARVADRTDRALNAHSHGAVIPLDVTTDLLAEGIDLPALTHEQTRFFD